MFILLIITCRSITVKDESYFTVSPNLDEDLIIEHVDTIFIEKKTINLTILESQVSLINSIGETIIIELKTIENSSIVRIDSGITIISHEGFSFWNGTIKSDSKHCKVYFNGTCEQCDIIRINGQCKDLSPIGCSLYQGYCKKCMQGYYMDYDIGECTKCPLNCRRCNGDRCILCSNGYKGDKCEVKDDDNVQSKLIRCDGSMSNGIDCITFPNCIYSIINECLSCNHSMVEAGRCEHFNEGILKSDDNGVICYNGYHQLNGTCMKCSSNLGQCSSCDLEKCYQCNETVIDDSGKCITVQCKHFNGTDCISGEVNEYPIEQCMKQQGNTCLRCNDGYYFNGTKCTECSPNCITCDNMRCYKCDNETFLEEGNCKELTDEIRDKCSIQIPGEYNKCAICKKGYYKMEENCYDCSINCNECNINGCLSCVNDTFLNDNFTCSPLSDLTNCTVKTSSGCNECEPRYYLLGKYCYECSANCINCNQLECIDCEQDYLFYNGTCTHFSNFEHCKSALNGKCDKCSFIYGGDYCSEVKKWMITFPVLVCVIIIIAVIALVSFIGYKTVMNFMEFRYGENVTVFKMRYSNVKFIKMGCIKVSTDSIDFGDELKVNRDFYSKLCIGSDCNKFRLQFSCIKNDKYEISVEPECIKLKKGYSCEFSVKLVAFCTCSVDSTIKVIASDFKSGDFNFDIRVQFSTELTNRLDYDEIVQGDKLGEGSFGIVFKGTFRGHDVAIKRMKVIQTKDSIEEFNKELSMLDKFRSNYIVYFYGSVISSNLLSMVTEFAPHGSMTTLIRERFENEDVKVKIIIDCAKGIEYLHRNGILHRDIKPDNFLIFDVVNNDKSIVNAKLTDFGSSRNINMMMTNLTFTRGIGTPKYMAPEILNKEHYKKPADIYSFAVTMYEFFGNSFAYSREQFRYEWNIAKFVIDGNRLPLTFIANEKIRNLIENCWKQDQKQRFDINKVIVELI